jgi:hypothetical protein
MSIAKKYLLLSALLGAVIALCLGSLLMVSYHRNDLLERRVQELESQLAQYSQERMTAIKMAGPGAASSPVDRMIKDLSTRFVDDPRTIAEKLRDFLNEQTDAQHQAIACKVIADMADNRDALGDQELDWLYRQQTGPVFKRVVAQVLSLRGDNQLLDTYIAEHQAGLASDNPGERRKALGELAKTRYAGAADMIIPLLGDTDVTVLLDALLALRATGNERHIGPLRELAKHPDPSVGWLAADTLNNLEILSEKARIRLLSSDIVAELPPIAP